jgi:AraC-like DNA-binding protein
MDNVAYPRCVRSKKRHPGGMGQRTVKYDRREAMVRVGTAMAIPAVLESLGANPAKVLAEAGFDPTLFDDPDNLISFAARTRLANHCVARTGCRHFGLLVGQQIGLHSLGLVGLLVKYSPDVGTALRSLVRYLHLHVHGATTSLETGDRNATLGYAIYEPHVEATDQIGAGAAAMRVNILRTLCGPDWKPVEIQFAHRRPENVAPFRRYFRAPLIFDAEQYAVAFAADWLNRSLPGADTSLHRLLQRQIDALDSRHGDDFPQQVRSVLRTLLITGPARADQVAALFSIHARTLNRRLDAFGIGFRELVDEGRFEIARQMLEDSAMPVSQIAAMLDYADASAFTRAFRRWSGTTPARWRATRNRAA